MMDSTSLAVIAPEILLLVLTCVIALVDLGVKSRLRNLTYWLTLVAMGAVAWLTGDLAARGETAYAFNRMVVSDPMGNWL
jgi:NADH-quinone oxidoreductase subunit N